MRRVLPMRRGTDDGPEHRPWAKAPTVFVGTAGVLGHRGPRAWADPWGHRVAEDNGEHGVRFAFVFCGFMFGAQRRASAAPGSGSVADAGRRRLQADVRQAWPPPPP
jgi:hypothetical protein